MKEQHQSTADPAWPSTVIPIPNRTILKTARISGGKRPLDVDDDKYHHHHKRTSSRFRLWLMLLFLLIVSGSWIVFVGYPLIQMKSRGGSVVSVSPGESGSVVTSSEVSCPTGATGSSTSIPIVIMSCNRPTVKRCIESLLKYRPANSHEFPIIVSQDCDDEETTQAIKSFGDQVLHVKQPVKTDPETIAQHTEYVAYYRIARHYKWIFHQVFMNLNYEQAIVVEDDMEVAPDFFDYFRAFLPVLRQDPTLFCVSAWNDNGKSGFVNDTNRFYRSDFFPGLGWMLTKRLWAELEPKWPATWWDDWLRHPTNRKNRHCIYPEVSRTFNFGRKGVSGGLFYEQHIGRIILNQQPALFTGYDKHALRLLSDEELPKTYPFDLTRSGGKIDVRWFLPQDYDPPFLQSVYDYSSETKTEELKQLLASDQPDTFSIYRQNKNLRAPNDPYHACGPQCTRSFLLLYPLNDFSAGKNGLGAQVKLLETWALMEDIREDVARVSYKNVVTFKQKLEKSNEWIRIYIAPIKS